MYCDSINTRSGESSPFEVLLNYLVYLTISIVIFLISDSVMMWLLVCICTQIIFAENLLSLRRFPNRFFIWEVMNVTVRNFYFSQLNDRSISSVGQILQPPSCIPRCSKSKRESLLVIWEGECRMPVLSHFILCNVVTSLCDVYNSRVHHFNGFI